MSSFLSIFLGNCENGYCYDVVRNIDTWFANAYNCFIAEGRLATFDGMTYEQISNLSFVKQLTENIIYWIGYSKLVYKWQHSSRYLWLRSNFKNHSRDNN